MVICTKCGFQNSDDASFCGSCGSFLEWTGEKVQPPVAPLPEPGPVEPEPDRRGLIGQARRALGFDGTPGGDAGAPVVSAADAAAAQAATAGLYGGDAGPIAGAPTTLEPAAPTPVVIKSRRVASAVDFEPAPLQAEGEDSPAVPLADAEPTVAAPPEARSDAVAPPPPTVEPPPWPYVPPPPTVEPPPWAYVPPPPVAAPPPPIVEPLAVKPTPLSAFAQRPAAPVPSQLDEVQPDAVKPGLARPRPTPKPVAPIEEGPRPGEVICAGCGIGNEPTRRFCRRCGASLAAVPAARPVPWWRRLFARRAAGTPAAGSPAGARPAGVQQHASRAAGGGGGTLRKLVAVVLVGAIVAGVAAYAFVPEATDAVNGAVKQVRIAVAPNYVPVNTAGQANGPSAAGHGPGKAFDGFSNTWWAAPANSTEPWIQASFSPPADIAKVLVTSGDPADFASQPRPHTIRLDFTDAKGDVVFTKQFDLLDSKDFQTLDVDARGAASIKVTVLSVYQSTSGKNVSITELEFRSRQ